MNEGFKLFEKVMTYAVDFPASSNPEYLNETGLSEKVFYEKLYVDRKKEQELIGNLSGSNCLNIIMGYPGTGKTTMVCKVLHQLEQSAKDHRCYIIKIDFKRDTILDRLNNRKKLNNWMNNYLIERLSRILQDEKIIRSTAARFILKELYENRLFRDEYKNEKISAIYHELLDKYTKEYNYSSNARGFIEWFDGKSFQNEIFGDQIENIVKCLRVEDYLYFLKNKNNNPKDTCIIFFDNVDSIYENEIRQGFVKFYLRKFAWMISGSAKVITCLREKTSEEGNYDQGDYYDPGTYTINSININDNECLDNGNLTELSDQIYKKRIKYLNHISQEKRLNSMQFENIIKLNKLLLEDVRLSDASLDMSNYDRRRMLVNFTNFTEYMINTIGLENDLFQKGDDDIVFILASYFYSWIVEKESIYDSSIGDIVGDYLNWEQQEGKRMSCNIEYQILALILNLTNNYNVNYSFSNKTTVGIVVKHMKELGYSDKNVKETIYKMYKNQNGYKGMLEISKYYGISDHEDITNNLQISVTPRAAFLCQYTIFKFSYILALIKKNKMKIFGQGEFTYDEKKPITSKTVFANLEFLYKLSNMHLDGLKTIKDTLYGEYGCEWLNHYRKYFCIRTNANPGNGLLLENLLDSHIKYLNHIKEILKKDSGFRIKNEMIMEYKRLEEIYREKISLLQKEGDDQTEEFSLIEMDSQVHKIFCTD